VVLLEFVTPPGDEPHLAKMVDLTMLGMLTGRERDEQEWRSPLADAGFRLDCVETTPSPMSILRATATPY
jgi:hypothetical protein